LFVGLGNPGDDYANTRHNAGFMAVDYIGERIGARFTGMCGALVAEGKLDGEPVVLAKPQQYMNRSGRSVASLIERYSLSTDDLTVIHDDIDISLGKVKEKVGGGSAGHNGVESIVDALGTVEFRRIRVGVGRPPEGQDPADYVLSDFENGEVEILAGSLEETCNRAINIGHGG